MSETTSSAVQRAPVQNTVKVSEAQSLIDRANQTLHAIAQRAYELFEKDGFADGRHLDHWFKAESELLAPLAVNITETDSELTVQAEVPGFRAVDLQVAVEPNRVIISGKREVKEEQKKGKATNSEQSISEIFRVISLPAEIDTSKATAALSNGVVELKLPKLSKASPDISAKKAA